MSLSLSHSIMYDSDSSEFEPMMLRNVLLLKFCSLVARVLIKENLGNSNESFTEI